MADANVQYTATDPMGRILTVYCDATRLWIAITPIPGEGAQVGWECPVDQAQATLTGLRDAAKKVWAFIT